jgi:hypothetical protein
MTEQPDNKPNKKLKLKNRFEQVKSSDRQHFLSWTKSQLEVLSSLYKSEITLRELILHHAPIVIIKRQGLIVSEKKSDLVNHGLDEKDSREFADRFWLDMLDVEMDTTLRIKCNFWKDFAARSQGNGLVEPPCSGPCLGSFCPKRGKPLRGRRKKNE